MVLEMFCSASGGSSEKESSNTALVLRVRQVQLQLRMTDSGIIFDESGSWRPPCCRSDHKRALLRRVPTLRNHLSLRRA